VRTALRGQERCTLPGSIARRGGDERDERWHFTSRISWRQKILGQELNWLKMGGGMLIVVENVLRILQGGGSGL